MENSGYFDYSVGIPHGKKAKDVGNKIAFALLLLTVFQISISFLYFAAVALIEAFAGELPSLFTSQIFLQLVIYVPSFAVTIFVAKTFIGLSQLRWGEDIGRKPLSLMFPSEKTPVLQFVLAVLICLAAGMVGNFISGLLDELLSGVGVPMPADPFDVPSDSAGIIVYFIAMTVFPPIMEEVLCRGYIYQMTKSFGAFTCAWISGFSFAFFHQNVSQFFVAFCFGFAVGYIIARYKNIWIGVAAHFINNLAACLLSVAESKGFSIDVASDIYCLTVLGLGIVAFVISFSLGWLKTDRNQTSCRHPAAKMFFSPAYIVFVAVCLGMAALNWFVLPDIA